MRRRAFLATAGAVLAAGCSGSSGDDPTPQPTPEPTPEPTPTPAPTPSQDYLATFREQLESSDATIDVDYLTADGGAVFLEYITDETTQDGIVTEMGTVAGTYAGAIDAGWAVDVAEVTILDAEAIPIGFYRIESEWAADYAAGELSGEEYSARILETLDVNA